MSDLTFYKIGELPARAIRTYILEDLIHPEGLLPVLVAMYRTTIFSDHGEANRAMAWLRTYELPVQTFQIFPLTYIVFYDMADVLMFKLAVVHQD